MLDHARYQRCALVQRLAQRRDIELLFLPAYAPHLQLSERFWQLVNKTGLSSKYYADHHAFEHAIIACIEQAPDPHQEEWESVLTVQLQSFKAVRVIGEASNVSVFPIARQTQRKVSSKAA